MHGTPRASTRHREARHGNDAGRGRRPHDGPAVTSRLHPGRRCVGRAARAEDSFVDHRDNADWRPRELAGHAGGWRQRHPDSRPLRHDAAAGEHRPQDHDVRGNCRLLVGRFLRGCRETSRFWVDWIGCQRLIVAADNFVWGSTVFVCAAAVAGWSDRRRCRRDPSLEGRKDRSLDPSGFCPGQDLGGGVAAAVGEALLCRAASAWLVHAGKRAGAILAGSLFRSWRASGRAADRQRQPRGDEAVQAEHHPGNRTSGAVRSVHEGLIIPAGQEAKNSGVRLPG